MEKEEKRYGVRGGEVRRKKRRGKEKEEER